jgi:hypothetical protein
MDLTKMFSLDELEDLRDDMFVKLDKGYQAIEEKVSKGEDTEEYEGFWKQLLASYEEVVENIRRELVK